ncbi:GNAT family N-acetyltransferase [Aquimarina sp. 2201CG5-10]|uniref:GNAT family N-acetyltransferase n=1 Tax=Aquimarina callyspongiae TaxID=3098150 RepID=UPI002AB5C6EE|nr:GNAT family N-acetyltransferase [Aquimarina sp. 2201CG5-10]MDY8136279.1 GNAT family N-acetyltransferase [Aquimarina sp. 2201CG5-10]
MKDNPFNSKIFIDKWNKHFNKSKTIHRFGFISQLSFVRHTFFPVYINVGKNLTKGVSYIVSSTIEEKLKNKVFLIYDVPDYFNVSAVETSSSLQQIEVEQYEGFLVNTQKYSDIESYRKSKFGKSSLYKIRKYQRRLESCFDIKYNMYFGEISREKYDLIFSTFKNLLERRFSNKQVYNNNLDQKEWDFYYDLIYDMVLEKKASIFVICDRNIPIAGSINYHSDEIAIGAITAFDTDYSKFYLGFTIINKLLEWSIDNKLKIFDFSKGRFGYKTQWSDEAYSFKYHILYNRKSWVGAFIAFMIIHYFRFKAFLRSKNMNEVFNRILFTLKIKNKKTFQEYKVVEYKENIENKDLIDVNINTETFSFLKRLVYDFLYSSSEKIEDIKVYRMINQEKTYLIKGRVNAQKVSVA